MSRNEFMRQLESLLQTIPAAERAEALQYYNDYFDDAGAENEQQVIEALGNPAKVAENIKRDLGGNASYNEENFRSESRRGANVVPYENVQSKKQEEQSPSGKGLTPGWIAVIVILAVLASPVWVPVVLGVIGTLFGIICAWFGIIVGCGSAAIGCLVAALVLLVVGFACMVISPIVGICVIGIALLCAGICLAATMLTVLLAGILTPMIWKGLVKLWKKCFGKKETTV